MSLAERQGDVGHKARPTGGRGTGIGHLEGVRERDGAESTDFPASFTIDEPLRKVLKNVEPVFLSRGASRSV